MFKKLISGIAISHGGLIPKWYGISYWLPDRDQAVCYPLVLNKIIRIVRNVYLWCYYKIKHVEKLSFIERISFERYQEGYAEGFERAHARNIKTYCEGVHEGWHKAFDNLTKFIDKPVR